jgi:aminopeptidase N
LMKDKVFIATNPNKVYALLRTYTYNCNFHSKDGYDFITTQIMAIDKFNPQLASSLMNSFSKITKLSKEYRLLAKNCLQIMKCNNLSTDVGEKIDKIYNMLG